MTVCAHPTSPRRVAELDALRGLCALAVGLYHLTYYAPFMVPGISRPSIIVWWGCYGVQIFFAISGFVILGTLERTRDVAQFARARAYRLLPEYWLALTITGTVAALWAPDRLHIDLTRWFLNLPPVQLWTGTPMVDGVYWSLNVEIGFYVGMALMWRLGWTRRIELLVLGWLVVKWLLWATAAPAWLTLLFLTEHAPYFAIGLVAYRVWTGERRAVDQWPVLAAVGSTVWLLDPIHAHWLFAGAAPLFLLLATGRARWLGQPLLVAMGRISYPFYLLHAVIGYTILARLQALDVRPGLSVIVALGVTGLLATVITPLLERLRHTGPLARRPRSLPARLHHGSRRVA